MDEMKKEADKYNAQNNANINGGLGYMGNHGVCPSGGRCPTCGRGWNYYPNPYWWNHPQVYYTNAPATATCSHM